MYCGCQFKRSVDNFYMFDEIAISIQDLFANYVVIFAISWAVIGLLIASVFGKKITLKRSEYCAYVGLVLLVNVLAKGTGLFSIEAIERGYYWLIVFLVVASTAGMCFGYGALAVARSRDIFANPYAAILAFIPFLNILLFVLNPKDFEKSKNQQHPILVKHGFLIGIAAFAVGIFSWIYFWDPRIYDIRTSAAFRDATMEIYIGRDIRADGLRPFLEELASKVEANQIDNETRLLEARASGSTIRYIYEVRIDESSISDSKIFAIHAKNCTHNGYQRLIELGATIGHVYMHLDGREYGNVSTAKELCDELGFRMRR